MFTARYGPSPHIKQTIFVFKVLIIGHIKALSIENTRRFPVHNLKAYIYIYIYIYM